jgi:hypothetical protein
MRMSWISARPLFLNSMITAWGPLFCPAQPCWGEPSMRCSAFHSASLYWLLKNTRWPPAPRAARFSTPCAAAGLAMKSRPTTTATHERKNSSFPWKRFQLNPWARAGVQTKGPVAAAAVSLRTVRRDIAAGAWLTSWLRDMLVSFGLAGPGSASMRRSAGRRPGGL